MFHCIVKENLPTSLTKSKHSSFPNFLTTVLLGLTCYNSFYLLPHNMTKRFSYAFTPSIVYNTITMRKEKRNTMNDTNYFYEKTSMPWKKNTRKKAARNLHAKCSIIRIPWMPEFSPIEFLKGVAERVTKAMCFSSMRRSSNRVSPSSLGRSKTIGVSVDYFRTAAVEDCIEFFHIQSSFPRSNSLTITPREEFTRFSFRKF